jgi:integrase
MIEEGLSPKVIQTRMGHSSVKVTYDLYGHLFRDRDSDSAAAAAIERRLRGG